MDDYVEQLLKERGVPEDMPEDVREQLANDLKERAVDFLNRYLIDAMSDQDVAKFQELLDNDPENAEAVQSFISEHVPDKEKVAAQALYEFKVLYLGQV